MRPFVQDHRIRQFGYNIFPICAVLAFAAIFTTESRGQTTNAMSRTYSRTVNAVQIRAVLPVKCRFNKPALLSIAVTNNGHHDISWTEERTEDVFDLNVVDTSGKRVPLTQKGKELKKVPNIIRFRLVTRTLRPTEAYSWTVDLADLFELAPGDYLASVSFEAIGSANMLIPLKLENMRLTVTPKSQP